MISLAMIVKPTDDEAELLDRALSTVAEHVDEICITITGENEKCEEVCEKYDAEVSHFEWQDDFAAARNYNFEQCSGDYIFWIDADDVVKGAENLETAVEKMKEQGADVGVCDYLYDFDDEGYCVVKYRESRIIKNDDCVKWAGEIHESFEQQRMIDAVFIKGVEILHRTNDERAQNAKKRNLEISRKALEDDPEDPRNYWNLAKSYFADDQNAKALDTYKNFIKMTGSDSEKYLAYHRAAEAALDVEGQDPTDYEIKAMKLKPSWPDAYLGLGEIYHKREEYSKAKEFLIMGMGKQVPEDEYIVWNPRDYDFNPLMLLAECYFRLNKLEKAKKVLEQCLKIYPGKEEVEQKLELVEDELEQLGKVDEIVEKVKEADSKEEIRKILDSAPNDIKSHPKLTHLRNKHFIKEESSGKDIAYVCGYTEHEWNPEIADEEGVGGSEEAVIQLTERWAEQGWNVTVYCNCGHEEKEYNGVTYKPFWTYNYRDKYDVVVFWRFAKFVDYKINADKIFVDLHDVLAAEPEDSQKEFPQRRLDKIDKILVKSKWQRDACFPDIPKEKFEVIPHGLDLEEHDIERDPHRLIWTSSYDRGLETLLQLFPKIKEEVPDATLDIFYGWGVWDSIHKNDPEMKKRKEWMKQKFEELDGVEEHGKVGQKQITKEYLKSGVWSYPTEFTEIFCITAAKVQALGVIPITTNVAALDEVVQHGTKIDAKDIYSNEEAQQEWLDAIISELKNPTSEEERQEMREWALDTFDWDDVAQRWLELFK